MNYENLFTPGYIGGLRIKNRVVMTAMGNGLAAENGEASDEIIACYKARAAGGCGLLITEFCAVDGENGIAETHQLQIHAPRFIKRLALLTDTLHRYDCKVFFQLFHPGARASRSSMAAVRSSPRAGSSTRLQAACRTK